MTKKIKVNTWQNNWVSCQNVSFADSSAQPSNVVLNHGPATSVPSLVTIPDGPIIPLFTEVWVKKVSANSSSYSGSFSIKIPLAPIMVTAPGKTQKFWLRSVHFTSHVTSKQLALLWWCTYRLWIWQQQWISLCRV